MRIMVFRVGVGVVWRNISSINTKCVPRLRVKLAMYPDLVIWVVSHITVDVSILAVGCSRPRDFHENVSFLPTLHR